MKNGQFAILRRRHHQRGHQDADRRRRRRPLRGRSWVGGRQAEDFAERGRGFAKAGGDAVNPPPMSHRARTVAGSCCGLRSSHPNAMAVEAALRVARAFGCGSRKSVRGGRAAFRLRGLRLRARNLVFGAAKPTHVARCQMQICISHRAPWVALLPRKRDFSREAVGRAMERLRVLHNQICSPTRMRARSARRPPAPSRWDGATCICNHDQATFLSACATWAIMSRSSG